jgi:hypothetical protein
MVLLHTSIGLLGLVLLYLAFFLRESDEGKLQNRLEELWVRIDDLSRTALTKQAAFIQGVSGFVTSGFDRVFGRGLFSAKAIFASLCFSAAAIWLAVVLVESTMPTINNGFSPFLAILVCVGTLYLGYAPRPFRYVGFVWAPAAVFVAFVYMTVPGQQQWSWNEPLAALADTTYTIPAALIAAGGVGSDIVFVAFTRYCLRINSRLRKPIAMMLLLVANGLAGLLLCLVPVVLLRLVESRTWFRNWPHALETLLTLASSNLLDAFVGVLWVLVSAAAVAHLLVWPVLERPIYSAQRYGLVKQPKLLAAIGVLALLFAWPGSPIVRAIVAVIQQK